AGAGLACLAERRWGRRAVTVSWSLPLAPLVTFLAWQGWLLRHWGELPLSQGKGNLTWPLQGFGGLIYATAQIARYQPLLWFGEIRMIPEVVFISGLNVLA